MPFIGIDFITSNGIKVFGVTGSWTDAREFGCLRWSQSISFSSLEIPSSQ